jgi:anaerobic selenocysteine-containing dehydrogenase
VTYSPTHLRICPLCEATCGLELAVEDGRVTAVAGDAEDVFSGGYLCPKGVALADLHDDPDRLTSPLLRQADGTHVAVSWEEAFTQIDRRLRAVIDAHGREAVGIYAGNPNVHNLAGLLALPGLIKALGTPNVFTASTMDQMPKHVAAGLMFGEKFSIPVPDIDRTDHLLVLGADPLTSNGSLWTAPDLPGRIRALLARGGRLVVVDPRRSQTARRATTHVRVRPGTDAFLLFGILHTILTEDLVALGGLADHVVGVADLRAAAAPFSPEAVGPRCGVEAAVIRTLGRELAAAERGCVYSRIGTHTVEFGTLAAWLVDVLNAVTGNLDREGGAMWPLAAAGQRNATGQPGTGRALRFGRFSSRVRGLPEVFGELPVAALAEEIDTPDAGSLDAEAAGARGRQIRALFTVAGNPALSAPDAGRLDRALGSLDLMVSVDIYLNETSRHADVVLPVPSPLARGHYDLAFNQLAVRNTARYSPPVTDVPAGMLDEWAILLRLAGIAAGQGPAADLDGLDDFFAYQLVQREVATPGSRVAGRDPAELLAALAPRRGAERLLDLLLRVGPYGEGFGTPATSDALSLDVLEANPHGVDLGPLTPRLPDVLRTPSGKVELAPGPILADVARLEAALDARDTTPFTLVGRRHLRSNNSWMHNLPTLASGSNRCTLQVNGDDASSLGMVDGALARVASRTGEVEVEVEVVDDLMPGVVSLPHGWGHDRPGTDLAVAARRPGVNSNVLTDPEAIDPLSGNAVLNGIPVTVSLVGAPSSAMRA